MLLNFCTLGIYQLYWFYMNWKFIKQRTSEDISPFWRAFFAVFFCYQLFKRVRTHRPDAPQPFAAGPLAASWIIPAALWKLPDPFWLVIYLAVFALLPVRAAIDDINAQEPTVHDPNGGFTAWNWVGLCLGGPVFLLSVYGTFLGAR